MDWIDDGSESAKAALASIRAMVDGGGIVIDLVTFDVRCVAIDIRRNDDATPDAGPPRYDVVGQVWRERIEASRSTSGPMRICGVGDSVSRFGNTS